MYTVEEFDKEKTKVLKYILYKKRSEREIRNKFSNEIEENLLEDIIEYLKEAKYINDKEFIERTVNNFIALKNLSIKEIRYKLLSKGLKNIDIEDYIYNNKEDLKKYEIKSIYSIIYKKSNIMDKEEIKQYLLKKGYESENINEALLEEWWVDSIDFIIKERKMAILTLETKKYAIKIDNFEGPLDLLCHLIDENKMNIYDINLSEITDQYIEYLRKQKELELEIASEFLVMASTLLYLKSKNLLPKQQEDEEEEITEEEIIRRIIEYKKFKEISKVLKQNYIINSNRFFKIPEEIKLPKQKLEKGYDSGVIIEIYKNLIERNSVKLNQNAKNIEKIALVENYTVASKVKEMYKVLVKQKRFVFNKLFSINKRNKQEVITAFSGLLELSRRKKVETTQDELFGDITVEKYRKSIKI